MKQENMTTLKRLIALASCGLLLLPSVSYAASALTVIDDAQTAAERMRNEAKAIADYHQALKYLEMAEKYVGVAAEGLTDARVNQDDAKNSLADAQKWRDEGNEWLYQAELALKQAEQSLAAMGNEADLRRAVESRQAQLADINGRVEELNRERARTSVHWQAQIDEVSERAAQRILAELNYDESRLDEAERRLNESVAEYQGEKGNAEAGYEAKIDSAEAQKELLEEELSEAETRLADFYDWQAEVNSAVVDATEARKNLAEASANLQEAETYCKEAQEYVAQAETDYTVSLQDVVEAKETLEPVERSRYTQGEIKYYSWKDNQGRKGRQVYQPYQFFAQEKDMEYGVQTAYLVSDNQSFPNGRMSGFTDTTLSVARNVKKKDYLLNYGLDISLPTGESRMKKNAVMSDDLVSQSRFGDGYMYTPHIRLSHKIGEEDTWTFGTSYAFKKSYAYDEALPNARINPGGEWAKTLEWLHAGQTWQALAQLTHSNYGRTAENGLTYREGAQTDLAVYYNRVLSPKQEVMVYFRYDQGNRTTYDRTPDFTDLNGTQCRRYYGVEWKNKIKQNSALRLMFNVMRAMGKNYDPLTSLSSDSRHRYGGLIGYDIQIDKRSALSLELEHFYMKDKSGVSYHGNNIYLKYSRSL